MTPVSMILDDGSEISIVHFQVQANGKWRLSCMPTMSDLWIGRGMAPKVRSEDPRAVNCPLCKNTEEFKRALAEAPKRS